MTDTSRIAPTDEQMLRHLRRSSDVARHAMALGRHPFGAALVGCTNAC